MKTIFNFLSAGMLLLISCSVSAGEYIPPPPGPYQSTVVIDIDTVEQNSSRKHQVYKFPQAELFNRSVPPLPARRPDSTIQRPDLPFMQTPLVPPQNFSIAPNVQDQWYDPTLYNTPWARNGSRQQQPYWGEPGYRGNGYDYYQYPGWHRNQYNRLNDPYSVTPPPWAMQPFKPYTGR